MVASVSVGRGAWTSTGKDNKSRYYEYILGKPLDGDSAGRDVNYEAVNLGVKAIQARINSFRYSPALLVDGVFGLKSKVAVEWLQTKLGLYADGVVGPATCKAMWRDLLYWYAGVNQVPASHLYGFMFLESSADPAAVGYTTPSDRGLSQINLVAHPYITVQQAFDPHFAINYTADRLAKAREKFSGKTALLQRDCSIAQHNSPLAAQQWYQAGVAPNEKIAQYVRLVLENAAKF